MEKVILVRYGEIMLKGLNRSSFEAKLIKNIKSALYGLGEIKVIKNQGRIYVEPKSEGYEFEEALKVLTRVFGIVSVSPVWKIDTDFDNIKEHSLKLVSDLIDRKGYKTFKAETKRGDKQFPMQSPEVSRELGAHILKNIPSLSVDVRNPDFILYTEIRDSTYIYSEIVPGSGGMPVGTNGKAVLLLSGGIDSPVAGWMIGKRGVEVDAVHFHSYPYTSDRAKEKVIELAKTVSLYCQQINLHIVPFTDIQLELNDKCPPENLTVVMRRVMMKIAEKIARSSRAQALITGECIGQVASQTMHALVVTNDSVDMPVFRPLIGMDKNEVVELARKIDTYETSILPYEDCCTVFVAKHPKTKPRLEEIKRIEDSLDIEEMINKTIEDTEVIGIKQGKC